MGRKKFTPDQFGVDMSREIFDDLMVEEFNLAYGSHWSLDEMLLHPREAARFCDDVRRKHRMFEVPDDIILRTIMGMRKSP